MPTSDLDQHRSNQIIEFAEILSQQSNFEEILRLAAKKLCLLLDADLTLILMVNPQTQDTIKTIVKEGLEVKHPGYRLVQNVISGWLLKHGQPFLTNDIKKDKRFAPIDWEDLPIKSAIGAVLRAEGVAIGSLMVLNKARGGKFEETELTFLTKIAIIAAPYLRNVQRIKDFFEASLPEPVLLAKYERLGLLGKSKTFVELLRGIEAAAHCDVRVLLEGKSGTGKELIAKAIHLLSERAEKPFVAVDCGAIPTHLVESEFFGHVKGAFTGATAEREGLIAEANHGTLFLDEISNLPLEMQTKLIRVLQESEVRPVGSNKVRKVDVRIISASSSSIRELVEEKMFREDLYYRIYVYPIYIPALADREEDIAMLANHFLQIFAKKQKKKVESFEGQIIEFLKRRSWAGNIRELENLVERLVTLAQKDTKVIGMNIMPADLKRELKAVKQAYESGSNAKPLSDSLADYEEKLIRKALNTHNWNQSRAARSLKTPIQTLRSKMKKLGIEKPDQ